MATKNFRHHKHHDFEVKVSTRRGKVVVTNNGMVQLSKPYKRCNMIDHEIFKEKFVEAS